jgi:hypothetical protein
LSNDAKPLPRAPLRSPRTNAHCGCSARRQNASNSACSSIPVTPSSPSKLTKSNVSPSSSSAPRSNKPSSPPFTPPSARNPTSQLPSCFQNSSPPNPKRHPRRRKSPPSATGPKIAPPAATDPYPISGLCSGRSLDRPARVPHPWFLRVGLGSSLQARSMPRPI